MYLFVCFLVKPPRSFSSTFWCPTRGETPSFFDGFVTANFMIRTLLQGYSTVSLRPYQHETIMANASNRIRRWRKGKAIENYQYVIEILGTYTNFNSWIYPFSPKTETRSLSEYQQESHLSSIMHNTRSTTVAPHDLRHKIDSKQYAPTKPSRSCENKGKQQSMHR